MKKEEIKLGESYTNEKGAIRKVTGVGPEYVLYRGQQETDCVRYLVVKKKNGPGSVGQEFNCTRVSFANWAKAIHSGEVK